MRYDFYQVWCSMDEAEWSEYLKWLAERWIDDHNKTNIWDVDSVQALIRGLLYDFEYNQFSITFYASKYDVSQAQELMNKVLFKEICDRLDSNIHNYQRPNPSTLEEWEQLRDSFKEAQNTVVMFNDESMVYIGNAVTRIPITNKIEYFS